MKNINDTATIATLGDASGGDTDADGALTYSITAGNTDGLFEIDTATGVISTPQANPSTTKPQQHILTVTADRGRWFWLR